MDIQNLNFRYRIRSPFLRFLFIILGLGIGFSFYTFKDLFDRDFVILRDNAALSFVVRGIGAGVVGLMLFMILYFFDGILPPSLDSGKSDTPRMKKKIRRSKK